jgi:poly-gamma-glutamate synthase PgsB/CapB
MGSTLESVALALANTTPQNGALILGEDKFVDIFKKCAQKTNSKLIVAKPYEGDSLDTFAENIGVALEVAEYLNLDKNAFFEGLKQYKRDPGALKTTVKGQTTFINAFSVNDPESTLKVYEETTKAFDKKAVAIVINTRQDRAFRIDQHIAMLESMQFKKVILAGAFKGAIAKRLEKLNIPYTYFKDVTCLLDEQVVFGCGNIKDDGMKIINFFEEGDNL